MEFPQYRKYKNIETYFKIYSYTRFEEINIIGNKYSIINIKANLFPEKTFIKDMLSLKDDRWEEISKNYFLLKIKEIKETKTKI